MKENDKYEQIEKIANEANRQKIKGSEIAPLVGMAARGLLSATSAAYG